MLMLNMGNVDNPTGTYTQAMFPNKPTKEDVKEILLDFWDEEDADKAAEEVCNNGEYYFGDKSSSFIELKSCY